MDLSDFLGLSWSIQLSLASGYSAYLICFRGKRDHHKSIDTAFVTLVFGTVAVAALYLLAPRLGVIWGSIAAFCAAIAAGIAWATHAGPDGAVKEVTVLNEDHGDRATYIPASAIQQINIRHKRA